MIIVYMQSSKRSSSDNEDEDQTPPNTNILCLEINNDKTNLAMRPKQTSHGAKVTEKRYTSNVSRRRSLPESEFPRYRAVLKGFGFIKLPDFILSHGAWMSTGWFLQTRTWFVRIYWIHWAPLRLQIIITVKGFRHFTIKNSSSRAPRTCVYSTEQRVKLSLFLRLTRSLRTFTLWDSKDITNIEYGFTVFMVVNNGANSCT